MVEKEFFRKKGNIWDGDEDFIHFLEEELTDIHYRGWPKIKENYKITIKIEVDN